MVLAWAVPFFTLSVAIEWVLVRKGKLSGAYETKDALTSMFMGVGNLISDLLMGFVSLGVLMWAWQFRFFDWGYSLPVILLALVSQDFIYYWKHRAAHRMRWFWTAHVVHHSSEFYNLTTALRQPFNTPSHHRVHHGTNPQYLDANYAGILIIWDKAFGTFVAEDQEVDISYGLVNNVGTFNPIKIAFTEMWGAVKDVALPGISIGARLKYLFAPPANP